jgi:PAS domain S-box-containing protein
MSRENEILLVEERLVESERSGRKHLSAEYRVDIKQNKPGSLNDSGMVISQAEKRQNALLSKSEGKKFHESAPALRAVFDSVRDGILVFDSGEIVLVNKSLTQMLGYRDARELIDKDFSSLLSPQDGERWEKFRKTCFAGDEFSPVCSFKGKRKDGSLMDFEASFTASAIAGKTYIIAAIREICGNRQFAELINEQEFRLLGDSILHQVWTADPGGRLDYANARALEYRGLSMEDVLKQIWQEVVHPDDLSLCSERWEKSLQTGEPYEVEFRLLGADGKYRWHLGRATAKRDESGKIIKWFGTNTDINDQKLAEESLRKSEERFQLAARATNDVMWDWDMVTNRIWWNEGIHIAFGYTPEEIEKVKDKLSWWRERIHPEDKEFVVSGIYRFLESREQAWKGEYRYICADGSFAAVIDRRIVVRDERGTPLRMVGALLDITERRQTEKALVESEQRLQQSQKMEALGTLTGGVAHDFNNLLTAIIGNTQLALSKLEANDPLRARLTEIEKATNRAAILTRQLLAFSRRQHLERRPVNLNETISEIMKLLQRIIGEDVEISLKCAPGLAAVFADPAQIEQVVMNLCVNAREAMPGGGTVTIETKNIELDEAYCRRHPYIRPGKYVQIKVTDTGAGIDEKIQARIFEPFFTTKEIGRGTGLGLSIAYGIVKQHDGCINVRSDIGKGSTFEIFLPVDESAVQRQRQTVQLPLFGGNETILVAEDEEALRNLAKDILGKLGYTVLLAKNGEEAVAIFAENRERINLLLFDMVMPRMGGAEAYEQIKDFAGDVPLIFMTGYSSEIFQKRFARQNGAGGELSAPVIQKPYNIHSLGHKVREALDYYPKPSSRKKAAG